MLLENYMDMKKLMLAVLFMILCWPANAQNVNAQDVTMGSLLEEMIDRTALAKYPAMKFSTKQFSSYDRRAKKPGGPDWFANEDRTNFLRRELTENGSEWVMFDADKPGAIVRWWMTFAGEGAGDGTIRIYIDGQSEPVVKGRAFDLISGGLLAGRPLSASVSKTTVHKRRGHNLYLPIPYNSCKITYQGSGIKLNEDGKISESSVAIYYIINYREYEAGTSIESFNKESIERYLPEINQAIISLEDPYSEIFKVPADEQLKLRRLQAGESMELTIRGMKCIKAFMMNLRAENMPQALRSTVITLSFDGKTTLNVPVGDFFGTGYEINPYETYFTKVFYDGTLAAFWPMPFQREAKIRITNYGKQLVTVEDVNIHTHAWDWDERSMYFSGTWKQFYNKQTGGKENPEDLNFVTLNGKGVYVGDLVTIFNGTSAWWGEGDEKIYVDGESFPSHFGTGSEDYYGYAWSRPEFFEHPFIAQPDGSGNMAGGTAVNIRFRALDRIPFEQNLKMEMELWHWTTTSVDYAPTTFFYMFPGGNTMHKFDPVQAKKDVRFPETKGSGNHEMMNGSIQGEKMEPLRIDRGEVLPRSYANWDWEEDAHLVWRHTGIGDVLTLGFRSSEAMPAANLELQLTQSENYGIVAISVNDAEEIIFDAYAPKIRVEKLEIDDVDIKEGWNTITVRVTGKNPEATNYVFGIDYLKVK